MSAPATPQLHQDSLKRTITLPQALGISFHQIVGGGVVSLTGVAIAMTGGGTPLAYFLAAVSVLISSIPMATMGAAIPVSGASYNYPARLLHPAAGFGAAWFMALGMMSFSLYGLAAGTYLHALNPIFDPRVVAIVMMLIFYVANVMGASFSAKLGIWLAIVMLLAFGVFIVFGLAHTNFGALPSVMPKGVIGLLQAASLLTFATGGGTVVAELGREMKNPGRTIPITVIGATIFAATMYALISLPAIGVLPIAEVAGKPLSTVGKAFLPGPLWVFFIVGGAVTAVIGTMNAQLTWGSRALVMSADDGWLPNWMGAVNKRFGTPHVLLTLVMLMGMMPTLVGLDISVIGSASSGLGSMLMLVLLACSIAMRYRLKERYSRAYFRIPLWLHWMLVIIATLVSLYQFVLLSSQFGTVVWITMAIWIGLGIVIGLVRWPHVKRTLAARAAAGWNPFPEHHEDAKAAVAAETGAEPGTPTATA